MEEELRSGIETLKNIAEGAVPPEVSIKEAKAILKRYKELEEENKTLKEYIVVAPNLDEMTAVKYSNIQREAYIKGRAEEQQKAEQIIYENYIPTSVIQKKKEEVNNSNGYSPVNKIFIEQVLQEILEEGRK